MHERVDIELGLAGVHDLVGKVGITGCLDTINRELRKRNERPLSTQTGKDVNRYRQHARSYARRKALMVACGKNPSFQRFVDQLDALPGMDRPGPGA